MAGASPRAPTAGPTRKATGPSDQPLYYIFDNLISDPAHPQTLYEADEAAGTAEIQKSTDGGASWTVTTSLATNSQVYSLSLLPTDPETLSTRRDRLAGAAGQHRRRYYVDCGEAADHRGGVNWLNPNAPATVYAGSPGYPTTPVVAPADDAFVAKFSPDGQTLDYLTYLGGIGNTEGLGIAVDSQGNAYVGGATVADGFPTTAGSVEPTTSDTAGKAIGFVTKLNPTGSALGVFDLRRGALNAIAVDGQGRAAATGFTNGGLKTTPSGFQTSAPDIQPGFVSQFSADGSALLYSSYLGSKLEFNDDSGAAIAYDSSGKLDVTGTAGTNFPTTAGAYQSTTPLNTAAFFAQIDPSVQGTASLTYATYLNGTDATAGDQSNGLGVVADSSGHAYIVGNTTRPTSPSRREPHRARSAATTPTRSVTRATASWRNSTPRLRATRRSCTALTLAARTATRPMPSRSTPTVSWSQPGPRSRPTSQ